MGRATREVADSLTCNAPGFSWGCVPPSVLHIIHIPGSSQRSRLVLAASPLSLLLAPVPAINSSKNILREIRSPGRL